MGVSSSLVPIKGVRLSIFPVSPTLTGNQGRGSRVVGVASDDSSPSPSIVERGKLDQWNPAKVWQGDGRQRCAHCWEMIKVGEWSKQNRESGFILHDDCAEDIGAYREWEQLIYGS